MEDTNKDIQDKENKDTITITQAELDRLIQQKIKDNETKINKKHERELSLLNLDEKERQTELLKQQYEDLKTENATLHKSQLKAEVIAILATKGIDTELADMCIGETLEDTQTKIKVLEKSFSKIAKDDLNSTVVSGAKNTNKVMTKAEFNKLGLMEKNNLYKTNPELYAELTN